MYRYLKQQLAIITIILILSGCAQNFNIDDKSSSYLYTVKDSHSPTAEFSPAFLIYDHQDTYNLIGRPSARHDKSGKELIYIDTKNPAIYHMQQSFSTKKDSYTNYIYRIHFPSVPFSMFPFHLSAGKNSGLIIVATLDSENRPVLVTAVHTCGCYLAIIPTTNLRADAFPENWKDETLKVYGERLPSKLDYREITNPNILVHVRPAVHRVINIEIIERNYLNSANKFEIIDTPLVLMEELERIPVNGQTTSFYYQEGLMKGHVKGSHKFWETLFLSLISLDLFVGSDKAFADTDVTGNPFYTSLKPWNRDASDMWDFKRFLAFWGWRL